jgi:prolyl-tRNA synthetase
LRNVNYGRKENAGREENAGQIHSTRRDYSAEIVADIAAAREGDGCVQCGQPLKALRGVEIGNIFKLGARYSAAMGCTFLDAQGQARPVIMGSYGIGVGRLLACVAEEHHDAHGLVWPVSVAPYQVHLVLLAGKGSSASLDVAERLYTEFQAAGIEVLYDDRLESPGVKFNDADLIGLPIRLTVGERSLKLGGVEIKHRDQDERLIVPVEQAAARIRAELAVLYAALNAPPAKGADNAAG